MMRYNRTLRHISDRRCLAGWRIASSNLESRSFQLSFLGMRRTIAKSVWAEMKTAFATGSVSLRELARQMNIPDGTVLARAKREGWARQIQNAKALAKREDASPAVTPVQRQSRRRCNSAESVTSNEWRASQSLALITSKRWTAPKSSTR